MKPYHAALINRVVAEAKASGVDYLIEPMNEYDALDWPDADMIAWHEWATDTIVYAGVPRAQIVGTAGRNADAIAAQCGPYSPHGIGTPEQIVAYPGVPTAKLIYSSDGYFTGTGGADARGRRGVGVDVAREIGCRLLALGAYGFELLPREVYGANNDRADVDRFDPAPVKDMAYAKQ